MNNKLKEIKTILSNVISTDRLRTLVKTDYSTAFEKYCNNELIIYRGDKTLEIHEFHLLAPRYRKSLNLSNVYTVLLSEMLPSWKEYPKRNHSVICTLDYNVASNFAEKVFCIFPKNGTKIGICPSVDIWDSFHVVEETLKIPNLEVFALNFEEFANLSGFEETLENKENILKFFDYLVSCTIDGPSYQKIKQFQEYTQFTQLLEYRSRESLIKFFDKIFNPIKNGFSLETIENLNLKGENELWFDNEYIAIPETLLGYFKKMMW